MDVKGANNKLFLLVRNTAIAYYLMQDDEMLLHTSDH